MGTKKTTFRENPKYDLYAGKPNMEKNQEEKRDRLRKCQPHKKGIGTIFAQWPGEKDENEYDRFVDDLRSMRNKERGGE